MKDRIKKKRSGNSVKMLLVLDHKKSKKIIKLYRHLRVNESNKSFNKQKKNKKSQSRKKIHLNSPFIFLYALCENLFS